MWQSRGSGVVRGLTLVAHRKRVAQAKRIGQRVFKAWDRNAHAFIWYEGMSQKQKANVCTCPSVGYDDRLVHGLDCPHFKPVTVIYDS